MLFFEKIDDKVDKEAIGVASLMLDSLNQVCFVFEKWKTKINISKKNYQN